MIIRELCVLYILFAHTHTHFRCTLKRTRMYMCRNTVTKTANRTEKERKREMKIVHQQKLYKNILFGLHRHRHRHTHEQKTHSFRCCDWMWPYFDFILGFFFWKSIAHQWKMLQNIATAPRHLSERVYNVHVCTCVCVSLCLCTKYYFYILRRFVVVLFVRANCCFYCVF